MGNLFKILPSFLVFIFWSASDTICASDMQDQLDFGAPQRYALFAGASFLSAGDIDGDGHQDLVAAKKHAMHFFRGHVSGTYMPPFPLYHIDIMSLATADLDADGKEEVITGGDNPDGAGGCLTIYLGRPDGTLALANRIQTGAYPSSICAHDLDNDGDIDVAVPLLLEDKILILSNDGYGDLRLVSQITMNPVTGMVHAADIDDDGHCDLVVSNGSGIRILKGLGHLTFDGNHKRLIEKKTAVLALADIDVDGDVDIACCGPGNNGQGGETAIFLNDGAGQFTQYGTAFVSGECTSLALADFTDNGSLEVIVGSASDHGIQMLACDAGDGLIPVKKLDSDENFLAVLASDLNGDDLPDIAATTEDSRFLYVWKQASHQEFQDCNQNGIPDPSDMQPSLHLEGWHFMPTEGDPLFAEPADLNGDGLVDLAVTLAGHSSDDALALYLNDGDGHFVASTRISMDNQPYVVRALDLDADDDADLVVNIYPERISENPQVIILRNLGSGDFIQEDPISNVMPAQIMLAKDVDLDGDLDIVLAEGGDHGMQILRNDVSHLTVEPRMQWGPSVSFLDFNDFNGDGNQDLLLPSGPNKGVALLSGSPEGFTETATFIENEAVESVVSGDFDNDGDVDFAATHPPVQHAFQSHLTLFLNAGDGRFAEPERIPTGNYGHHAMAGDLNDDGITDVAVITEDGVSVLLADSAGLRFASTYHAGTQFYPMCLAAADFDGNGTEDFVVPSPEDEGVYVLPGLGAGMFDAPEVYAGAEGGRTLFARDMDDDGDLDLVAYGTGQNGHTTKIRVIRNEGEGRFSEIMFRYISAGHEVAALADFTGDGYNDVLNGDFFLWPGDETGALQEPVEIPRILDATYIHGMIARDLNQDNLSDLIVSYQNREIQILFNQGDGGGFSAPVAYQHKLDGIVAVYDVDVDGDPDIVAPISSIDGIATNSILVLFNNGNGEFEEGPLSPAGISLDDVRWSSTFEDINGDGRKDLCATMSYYDTAFVMYGEGQGRFAPASVYAADEPFGCVVHDIEGDGDADIIVSTREGLSVFVNAGEGVLSAGHDIHIGQRAYCPLLADLDSSGRDDLAWINHETVAVLRNISSPAFSHDDNDNGFPDDCEGPPFHRGDVNGDGRVSMADVVMLVRYRLQRGDTPLCMNAADANGDGWINIADVIWLLSYLYRDGRAPPYPGPADQPCGLDPDLPGTFGNLGCQVYEACQP